MAKDTKSSENTKFDFKKFISLCIHSWRFYLVCIVVFVGLATLYALIRQPKYEIDAQLMLPQDTSIGGLKVDMASSFNISDMIGGASSTDNEISVLLSHNVMLNTAKDMDLNVMYLEKKNFIKWNLYPYKSSLKISTLAAIPDTLSRPLIFTLSKNSNGTFDVVVKAIKDKIFQADNVTLPTTLETSYGPFTIEKTKYFDKSEAYKFRIIYNSYAAAAESYAKNVNIFAPNKKTDFIALSYVTPDPKFGIDLLDNIIKNYNNVGINYRNDRQYETLDFVDKRLSTLKNEMTMSESQLEQFKINHKITMPEYDTQVFLQKASQLEMAQIQAEMENDMIRHTKKFIENPENKYSLIPDLSSSPSPSTSGVTQENGQSTSTAISDILKELNAYNMLMLERMKVLQTVREGNPQVKTIDVQLDALRNTVIESIDRALDNSDLALKRLKQENSQIQSRINSLPTIEREYISMQRLMTVQEQLYLFLLKQREEASMNISKDTAQIQVIDQPHALTESAGMKPVLLIALALFMALAFPSAWIYLFKYNQAPYYNANDIKNASQMPCIAEISDDTESVRRLRNELQHLLSAIGGKIVSFVSSNDGEGKSTTALAIAESLASTGAPTLLIDADFHNPSIAAMCSVPDGQGLSDALANDNAPDMHNVKLDNGKSLDVITAGKMLQSAPDMVASSNMAQIIDQLKQKYQYIIIDTASAEKYSDVLSMGQLPDITVYLTRLKHTTVENIKFANSLYHGGRLQRMALVVKQ